MSGINQRQIQGLLQKLSPQQIQMIKLLELPAMQLEQRIKREIEENPVLDEEVKDVQDETEQDDTPTYKYQTNNYSQETNQQEYPLAANGLSLRESLQQQLEYYNLDETQKLFASYIIGSIDDDGYLRRDLNSIVDDIAFCTSAESSVEELERLLMLIHNLEPRGVGARNLQECLLLQMEDKELKSNGQKLAVEILTSYFEEFKRKHYDKLIARLDITQEELHDAIDEITKLSPKPGNSFSESETASIPYITPDFILDNQNGELELSLNSYNLPQVKISRHYLDLVNKMTEGGATNDADREVLQFVRNKIDSAKWFIKAIRQRHDTLLRTMSQILDYQHEYFQYGDISKLRPMRLKDIADRTSLDVSTISRVVNSKYIQTPFGVIFLKQLFSEGLEMQDGGEVSSHHIKNFLKECLDKEDKNKPLTDEELMNMLKANGYKIARRTVAKYREMLDIPVARLRKEL